MADLSGSIGATGTFPLGEAMGRRVSSWSIQFTSASFVGSVAINGTIAGGSGDGLAVGYKDHETSAVATSAITGARLVLVDSAGLDISLECTAFTSGALTWEANRVAG